MRNPEIDDVVERVHSWPSDRQERAVAPLLVLEERDGGGDRLSEGELTDIMEAEAEIERGKWATGEAMAALFDRDRVR